MEEMKKQAENVGTEFVTDIISDVDFQKDHLFAKGKMEIHLYLIQ